MRNCGAMFRLRSKPPFYVEEIVIAMIMMMASNLSNRIVLVCLEPLVLVLYCLVLQTKPYCC